MNIINIKALISSYRDIILGGNTYNFDIESKEIIEAIIFRPDKEVSLLQHLWKRSMIYSRFNLSKRPPLLLRHNDENSEDYLERCYKRFNR